MVRSPSIYASTAAPTSPLAQGPSHVMKDGFDAVSGAASRPIGGELSTSSAEVQYAAFQGYHPSNLWMAESNPQNAASIHTTLSHPLTHTNTERTPFLEHSSRQSFSVGKRNATSAVVGFLLLAAAESYAQGFRSIFRAELLVGGDMHACCPLW